MPQFTLRLNGELRHVSTDPEMPLLYVLRDILGERTARFGCGGGQCGACTVLVGGRAMNSCDVPVSAIDKPVETSAALTGEDGDHPILKALMKHAAGQCGYCLAGIAIRAKACLDADPRADRKTIARALDGNLCRCGAHNRILDALEEAATQMAGAS